MLFRCLFFAGIIEPSNEGGNKPWVGECQDKIRCLTQQRDYARTHQKIVEIPVEKPVLYEKCEACDRTAYQNEKAKYETQKERLAGQYKAKTVIFQTTLFLLAWYSLTTTLFQAVQSDVFLSDCKSFFHDAASFIQTFIGWTIAAGHSAAQISTKIPNAFIAGIIYWLLLILVVGICVAGTGILVILIEIKVIELYKKNCWDFITLLMILTSAAVIIYFGESIKKTLSVNLLLLFVLSQGVYVGLRCYLKNQLNTKLYWSKYDKKRIKAGDKNTHRPLLLYYPFPISSRICLFHYAFLKALVWMLYCISS